MKESCLKGCFCSKAAFALIELLVVVLIIGILAAVAVPQYKKAVVKARFTEAITNLRAIGQADTVCRMKKGVECNIEELDVSVGELTSPQTDLLCPSGIRSTDHFEYCASGVMPTPVAQYIEEDVCLCYLESGEIVLHTDDSCGPAETTLDYAQLLNMREDSNCACC